MKYLKSCLPYGLYRFCIYYSLPLIVVASAMTLRAASIYTKSLKAKIVRIFKGALKGIKNEKTIFTVYSGTIAYLC